MAYLCAPSGLGDLLDPQEKVLERLYCTCTYAAASFVRGGATCMQVERTVNLAQEARQFSVSSIEREKQ